jgi:hypothetical protein
MGCGCGGGKRPIPLTSGDVAAGIEAAASGDYKFRLVRPGVEDEPFATYAAARAAASAVGGVVRTYKPPEG